ncbi:MAG: hypothetical protein N3A59_06480 [Thermodesulfovibrionales bacterium]|nr:hypothetical protein [Thermodesulfovibrionales bacterium]
MGSITMKKYFLALSIVLTVLSLLMGCAQQQFKTFMFEPEPAIIENWGPNGIAWNGKNFIIGDNNIVIEHSDTQTGWFFSPNSLYNSDGFYKFPRNLVSLNKIVGRPIQICDLAWEGECCGKGFLWIADALNKEIIKLTGNYEFIKRIPSPAENPNGLTFDGKNLWVADSKDAKIYKISSEDGSVLEKFNSPVDIPTGLAWDCENLWIIGMNTCKPTSEDCYSRRLLKLNISTGKVTHEIKLPKQIIRPSALVWVDGILWTGDYYHNRIFKIKEITAFESDDNRVYKIK